MTAEVRRRQRPYALVAIVALAASLGVINVGVLPASAGTYTQSVNVALVPNASGRTNNGGTFPKAGFPGGYTPAFYDVSVESIRDADVNPLISYDTVVLNSICDIGSFLANARFKSRIEEFVSQGGKLLIWDSECQQTDYSNFAIPFQTSNPGALGAQGTLADVEENSLSRSETTSPEYVNVGAIATGTDAVGDANVFTTHDPRWYADLEATNALGVDGPVQAYANLGSGLIVYCGLDKDLVSNAGFDSSSTSGSVHLNRIWYLQMKQGWDPDRLPHGTSVVGDDRDGDGLKDSWETNGLDVNNDQIIDVDLPAMGANPDRSDVFLQINWMKSETTCGWIGQAGGFSGCLQSPVDFAPTRAQLDAMVNAFDAKGVTLHIDAGSLYPMTPSNAPWPSPHGGEAVPYTEFFAASRTDRGNALETAVHTYLYGGWESVFHLAIIGDNAYDADNGGTSFGWMPGNAFFIRLNQYGSSGAMKTRTLMHELGHNLGLNHGGPMSHSDNTMNCKPAYTSVMNYLYQLGGSSLDYQRVSTSNLAPEMNSDLQNCIKVVNPDETYPTAEYEVWADWPELYFRGGQVGWIGNSAAIPSILTEDPNPSELEAAGLAADDGDGALMLVGPTVLFEETAGQYLSVGVHNPGAVDSSYSLTIRYEGEAISVPVSVTAHGDATVQIPLQEDRLKAPSTAVDAELRAGNESGPVLSTQSLDYPVLTGDAVQAGLALSQLGTTAPEGMSQANFEYLQSILTSIADGAGPAPYDFEGFFQPIKMGDELNSVRAGSTVPVRFSLNGDQGMSILSTASPNPSVTLGGCDLDPSGAPVQAAAAGGSTLTYDSQTDQYIYKWKTSRSWAGQCGTLTVVLADGTSHSAEFTFSR